MRLIDADELYEEIRSMFIVLNGEDIFQEEAKKVILEHIEDQPTAYDVEKVVEELEEMKTYNLNFADAMCDIQKNGIGRTFICLQDAIEIVKEGAKE